MKRILLALWMMGMPIAASAQFLDGLPAATSVSPTDIAIICQGGLTGHPGTCTTRRTTVNQFGLPLSGGTLTGPLTMGNDNPIVLDSSNSQKIYYSSSHQVTMLPGGFWSYWNVANPVTANNNQGWNLFDIDYNYTGSTPDPATYTPIYSQTVMRPSIAAGSTTQFWAGIFDMHDISGQAGVSGRSTIGIEVDLVASGAANGAVRDGVTSILTQGPGAQVEGGTALHALSPLGGGQNGGWDNGFRADGYFYTAILNLKNARPNPAGAHSIWMTAGQDIAFDTSGAGGAPNTSMQSDGQTVSLTGNFSVGGLTKLAPYTVATLPTCNSSIVNSMAVVSDATAPTYNGALTGSGTVRTPVFCNGTAWTSH